MGQFKSSPLLARDVAMMLGVSERRVHQLDDVLCPLFVGRTRVYNREAIDRYCAARDAERCAAAKVGQ